MNIQLVENALQHAGAAWVLWLLLGLSLFGLAIIIERATCYWASRDNLPELRRLLSPLVRQGQWDQARKLLSQSPSFESRVAQVALTVNEPETANEHMLGETETIRLEMERYLAVLSTLGSNAPFLGLLGTVIGIIGAFRELDQSQGQLTEGLMSEIGEALVATAVGLLVALPAIFAFNIFRRVVQARVAQADALRHDMVAFMRNHNQREK